MTWLTGQLVFFQMACCLICMSGLYGTSLLGHLPYAQSYLKTLGECGGPEK